MLLKHFLFGILFTTVSCFLFTGCSKDNSTVQNSVTIKGRVYSGVMNTTTNLLIIGPVISGAEVTCTNFPGSVKTANDGTFTLTIQAVRTFSGINSDSYTVQASSNGADESITVYGKPGDTIEARDFVLYQHTTTSAPRRPQ